MLIPEKYNYIISFNNFLVTKRSICFLLLTPMAVYSSQMRCLLFHPEFCRIVYIPYLDSLDSMCLNHMSLSELHLSSMICLAG